MGGGRIGISLHYSSASWCFTIFSKAQHRRRDYLDQVADLNWAGHLDGHPSFDIFELFFYNPTPDSFWTTVLESLSAAYLISRRRSGPNRLWWNLRKIVSIIRGLVKMDPKAIRNRCFITTKYMTTYSDRWTFRITIIKETGNYGNTWPCWIRSIIVYNFTAHLFEITELSTPLQVDYGRLSWKDLTHSGRRLL